MIRLAIGLAALLLPACASDPWVELDGHRYRVEIADTDEARARGLMFRDSMDADRGMLFRFDEVRRHCLWMKDTPLPLSAAFFDEDGLLVDVIDLEPFNTEIRCSKRPARYALEMNQGWFAEREIGRGARLAGIPVE